FEASCTYISKLGSSHLLRALFQASIKANKHDPVLKSFYEKKRKQGKHYYVCIGAVARKLCYIIYAILKSNKPYEVPPHTTET
ncbi:IS110 family transposase, partial [Bacillus cereus]|nr:IS110 family transposase [Bacillus cereus]